MRVFGLVAEVVLVAAVTAVVITVAQKYFLGSAHAPAFGAVAAAITVAAFGARRLRARIAPEQPGKM